MIPHCYQTRLESCIRTGGRFFFLVCCSILTPYDQSVKVRDSHLSKGYELQCSKLTKTKEIQTPTMTKQREGRSGKQQREGGTGRRQEVGGIHINHPFEALTHK